MVLKWITQGARVPWITHAPTPFNKSSQWEKHATPAELIAAREEIDRFLQMGALEEIPASQALYLSPLFMVLKPHTTNKWRLILDLRWLNSHTRQKKFRAEQLGNLEHIIQPNDQLVSWDMQDGFHLIAFHPDFRKFFQFQFQGRFYQYTVLPFGWTLSPWIYCKTMKVFSGVLRREGLRIHSYVDDYLLAAALGMMSWAKGRVEYWLKAFGLARKPGKGQWMPSTTIRHLGVAIDSVHGVIQLDPENASSLMKKGQQLVTVARKTQRRVRTKKLQSFLGSAQFATVACPELQTYLRLLYQGLDRQAQTVRLSGAQVKRIKFIVTLIKKTPVWKMWIELPRTWLVTDASPLGWGAQVKKDGTTQAVAQGLWTPIEAEFHITRLETRAVRRGLQALSCHLNPSWGLVSDATATVGAFRKRASPSPRLQKELMATLLWLQRQHLQWPQAVLKVSTRDNTVADALSRLFYVRPLTGWECPLRLQEVLPAIATLRRENLLGRVVGLPEYASQPYQALLNQHENPSPNSSPDYFQLNYVDRIPVTQISLRDFIILPPSTTTTEQSETT
jgi:hypothetical protein